MKNRPNTKLNFSVQSDFHKQEVTDFFALYKLGAETADTIVQLEFANEFEHHIFTHACTKTTIQKNSSVSKLKKGNIHYSSFQLDDVRVDLYSVNTFYYLHYSQLEFFILAAKPDVFDF